MKRLGLISRNVAVQLDEPPFYFKIVVKICNYRDVVAKKLILTVKLNFEFSARFFLTNLVFCIECYQTFTLST